MSSFVQEFIVKEEDCISDLAEYLPAILGTYVLVKWMEIVSVKNIYTQIDKSKYMTVGQRLDIEHLKVATLGDKIEVISTITKQDKRDILFEAKALNSERVLIAKATHKRVLMPLKVMEKVLR